MASGKEKGPQSIAEMGKIAQIVKPAETQWEYKVHTSSHTSESLLEQSLNELGDDGWEAVGLATTETGSTRCILKRKKPRSIELSDS